jgi:hypothetical protein
LKQRASLLHANISIKWNDGHIDREIILQGAHQVGRYFRIPRSHGTHIRRCKNVPFRRLFHFCEQSPPHDAVDAYKFPEFPSPKQNAAMPTGQDIQ